MEFVEYIEGYKIIRHGEIIVYNDNEVRIELIDGDEPIILKIQFRNQGGRVSSISQEVEGDTLVMKFINFERDNSIGGVFEPIQIGKISETEYLYFSCVIHTLNSNDGNRLLKYSFLKKQ